VFEELARTMLGVAAGHADTIEARSLFRTSHPGKKPTAISPMFLRLISHDGSLGSNEQGEVS
jgi:hypothetical protein